MGVEIQTEAWMVEEWWGVVRRWKNQNQPLFEKLVSGERRSWRPLSLSPVFCGFFSVARVCPLSFCLFSFLLFFLFPKCNYLLWASKTCLVLGLFIELSFMQLVWFSLSNPAQYQPSFIRCQFQYERIQRCCAKIMVRNMESTPCPLQWYLHRRLCLGP